MPCALIIQRTQVTGQQNLSLDEEESQESDQLELKGYIYRAITTNQDHWSDSEIIHWYNQRGEASENSIKELKLDLGGD